MRNSRLIIIPGMFLSLTLFSQQMPEISLFGANQTFYNPGSVGNQEVLAADFLFRANWRGFDGAPFTQIFCAHAPLRDPAVAMGILLEHDAPGGTNYTGVYINYAYRIKLGVNKISFGLKAGLTSGSQDYFTLRDNPDPTFSDNNRTFYVPNFGIGVLYYGRQYWAGVSIPRLFGFENQASGAYGIKHDFWRYEYFITGGGRIPAGSDWSFEPSALVVFNSAYKLRITVMGTAIYKSVYKAGLGYRSGEALIMAMGYQLNRQFSLGYCYDLSIGKIADYSFGSHEINIHYKFGYKVNASNPRGF